MKRRALVSVSDKQGVVEFSRALVELGFEIISTGGTAGALRESDIPVTLVSEVTGEPEILDGRVKTLHPKIHGGILADLGNQDHVLQLVDHDIAPIDLLCVNLYPFEKTIAGGASEEDGIENIDIGGPAMIRAAAKNFQSVAVVSSPEFYDGIITELKTENIVSEETRRKLALAAFRRTAEYDTAISTWLAGDNNGNEEFPESRTVKYSRAASLRYGENPHQEAAYYAEEGRDHLLSGVETLQGREISFNNLFDLDAARTLLADITELDTPAAAVIVKHANPCGASIGSSVADAYRKALASDPVSAFGGIIALSGEVDGELAEEMSKVFTEILIAPSFTEEAKEIFASKPNMRVLTGGPLIRPDHSAKHVAGGILLQQTDRVEADTDYKLVTESHLSPQQRDDALLAWRVAKNVKSNAIVLVKDGATVGVGAGQMSRVDSAGIAVKKAGERASGSVAASDAFFPFADGLETLTDAGVSAVVQPGGSKRDDEVIAAANRSGLAMVFTGRRHFLH
jgi:phosphoribosylaminoimidazolecarboxamide formyltransferase/IMP cyclohydrolase